MNSVSAIRGARAAGFAAVCALAMAPVWTRAQAPDMSQVQIKTTKISNNFYTLEGQGGMIGVLAGPDGVLMVDTQFAPLTDKIVAAIRQISTQPIRFVINTHVHGDHTGGNENLAKLGATIMSRDELRWRLAHPNPGANGAPGTPAPAAALPKITYDGPVTFHMNGEEVEAIPVRRAHTDGDTLVHFVNNDVLMTGDFYRSAGFPNIDRANGGSLDGNAGRPGRGDRNGRTRHQDYPRARSDGGPRGGDGASGHDPDRSRPGGAADPAREDRAGGCGGAAGRGIRRQGAGAERSGRGPLRAAGIRGAEGHALRPAATALRRNPGADLGILRTKLLSSK